MQVVHEHCAGLDVHKKSVVACRITPEAAGEWHKEIRRFGTLTDELLELADWLRAGCVTHIAMESTGVYWKPIFNILESDFEVLLVNAQHIKFVPGRKTELVSQSMVDFGHRQKVSRAISVNAPAPELVAALQAAVQVLARRV